MSNKTLEGLYLITDEQLTPYEKIEEFILPALRGGARIIQFRDKSNDFKTQKEIALRIKNLCHQFNAIFIVNDFVDLAIEIKADGIHIGKDDEDDFNIIKKFFKNKIIGVSCYGDVLRAKEFEHKGVSYVAFGSFFASATKPNAPVISLDVIDRAKKLLNIPICAIGGINEQNIDKIISRGANMAAVISDVWKAKEIEQKTMILSNIYSTQAC